MSEQMRRCGMGTRCRAWELVDGQRQPALLTKPEGLCDTCMEWVSRVVHGLPYGWLKLELTIGEHRAPHNEKTRRPKPGSRIPINVTTDALMRDIEGVLLDASKAVANEMAMTLREYSDTHNSNRQMYRRVKHSAHIVEPNIDKLLANADGGLPMVRRLVELQRAVVRHLGETAQRERLHLPCPACGAQGLVKEVQDRRGHEYHSDDDGSTETPEVVRCTNCEGEWTEAEYKWLSHMVLSEREELEVVEWLLAEARWQRDVATWLAAERAWLLTQAAKSTGMDAPEFEEALRLAAE